MVECRVANILANLKDPSYTPTKVVDLFTKNGFLNQCDPNDPLNKSGTNIPQDIKILNDEGLQTRQPEYFGNKPTDYTINHLKPSFDAGWTSVMALEFTYPDNKVDNHLVWITNIDKNNNVWILDSGHGKSGKPINLNQLNPSPKLIEGFLVKKKLN